MATIKAYTDIEQSRKLAKVLPIESADMCYYYKEDIPQLVPFARHNNRFYIPCWSLAALLGILQYPTLFQGADQKWGCTVWIDATMPYSVSDKDEPIDACYEMILKLNELKVL